MNKVKQVLYVILIYSQLMIISTVVTYAQQEYNNTFLADSGDSTTYLPQIKFFHDSLSFGPYILNSELRNRYFITKLPQHTSKVVMKYVDPEGEQLGEAYVRQGTDLTYAEWINQAKDIGFVLSPSFILELYYQDDSIAVYKVPYIVYPDTVQFSAENGWGPFITNTYQLAEGWQPVPEQLNTFSVKNLPPRTDSLKFEILTSDSTVVDSLWIIAQEGELFDTAAFANVRMDSLPLTTECLRTLIWCDGGPKEGLSYSKKIHIIPQKLKLKSLSEDTLLTDSIPVFIENELTGQALSIDTNKYAEIANGPGMYDLTCCSLEVIYRGPYSFDLLQRDFSIEAWIKFDTANILHHQGVTTIMSVDSVWRLWVNNYSGDLQFVLSCEAAVQYYGQLFTASIPYEKIGNELWHHIALTCDNTNHDPSDYHFYYDAVELPFVDFHEYNYHYIKQYVNYTIYLGTQPLYLGYSPSHPSTLRMIDAMDEVRLWRGSLWETQVKENYRKKILQSEALVGYWNFDDLRNRLGYTCDLSYNNNRGQLKNGATFIPQYASIQLTPDSIFLYSSSASADSVVYQFKDQDDRIISADTSDMKNSGDTLLFDLSSLPYTIDKLCAVEYVADNPDTGYMTEYRLECLPPIPIATPRYNWNTFYSSPGYGRLYNSIIVSGLPENTYKVELGFQKNDTLYDVESYTQNSIPYRYSLTLNGTDNYVKTSLNVEAPELMTLSFWFKTTTTEGGQIIGFSDSQTGKSKGQHDREVIMMKDGSLRFYLRTEDSTYVIPAVNKYNDGGWHHVGIVVNQRAEIQIDGCLVNEDLFAEGVPYSGYWVIGRNTSAGKLIVEEDTLSEYFQGTICEMVITDFTGDRSWINENMYGLKDVRNTTYYYRFNEGKGTVVHDSVGNNNATLEGSTQNWYVAHSLSRVVWNNNMLDFTPGQYDFYAKVFYPEGPQEGAFYKLGRNQIEEPFLGTPFLYDLTRGYGYFNEGTKINNYLYFVIDYTGSGNPDWETNYVSYKFFTPDHTLISDGFYPYTYSNIEGDLYVDMGEAVPGSYLSIEMGYLTTSNDTMIQDFFPLPVYINPMMAPIVSGNFGPFNQAIAPGTMEQMNKFLISTEIISDLNKVKARFYDKYNNFLGETDAVQDFDTLWHFTYDMGTLSPPTSKVTIEYYLGQDSKPAYVQGPFNITIHKTRPKWFDFIADTDFHDVHQNGNDVSFSVHTPLTKPGVEFPKLNGVLKVVVPSSILLIGKAVSELYPPVTEAKLKYNISENKLSINQDDPSFSQKTLMLSGGNGKYVRFSFYKTENDEYKIDDDNNLIAIQNFSEGGSLGTQMMKLESIGLRVKHLIQAADAVDPESIIVQPSFQLKAKGSYRYASRLHLMVDTISGGWGSVGDLNIDANPHHEEAFNRSASYQFYSGAIGLEFALGAKFLEGLLAGYFGLQMRVALGFGHSYITIPHNKTKELKSGAFQVYGRFYIEALWGWYEKTIWGPKLFYSKTFWGDDLSHCFPPEGRKSDNYIPPENTSMEGLVTSLEKPLYQFSKMSMPVPEPQISSFGNNHMFSWLERGKSFGERQLKTKCLSQQTNHFSDNMIIELNNHAINRIVSDAINEDMVFLSWAQTRYDDKSILNIKPTQLLKEFVKAQDIWYAIYDYKHDSLIIKQQIADDTKSINSGRAESNPVAVSISDSSLLITWQVADLDNYSSDIWYLKLEKVANEWLTTGPEKIITLEGIATDLQLESPKTDEAVVIWLNTDRDDSIHNSIMSMMFDGNDWTSPVTLLDEENENYNYLTMNLTEGYGGLVVAAFVEDSLLNSFEKVICLPWDKYSNYWATETADLLIDTVCHLQLPQMTVREDGRAVIAVKSEEIVVKNENEKISQVDLLVGDFNYPYDTWKHIEANRFVCDTTKQVADMQIAFVSGDTVMILSNEFPLMPTNTPFEPQNGIIFGDPYMNLVLRSFLIDDADEIHDVDENNYFTSVTEYPEVAPEIKLYQNYPNPCSEYTTIPFEITGDTRVRLELFDMKGNSVATLMEQQLSAGSYEINLNVSLLQPGMYTYRMTSGNYTASMRMIVGY